MSFNTLEDWIQLGELGKSKRQRRRDRNNAIAQSAGYATMDQMMRAQAAARAAAAAAPPPPPPPPIDMTQIIAASIPAPAAPSSSMPVQSIPLSSPGPMATMPVPTGGGQPGSPAYSGGSSSVETTTEEVYTPASDVEVENADPLSDVPPPEPNVAQSQADAEAFQNAFVESQTSSQVNQVSGMGRFRSRSLHRFHPSQASVIDRMTNPRRFRKPSRKVRNRTVRHRSPIRNRRVIHHLRGLGQVFSSSADAKAKAAQLVRIANTSLETLWEKASVQKTSALDNSPIVTSDQVAYVKASAVWITQANAALSAMDPNDTDPIIDQLSNAVSVIVERRQELTDQGIGDASPLSAAGKAFVTSLINDIESGASKLLHETDPKQGIPTWVKWGAGIYLAIRFLEAVKK